MEAGVDGGEVAIHRVVVPAVGDAAAVRKGEVVLVRAGVDAFDGDPGAGAGQTAALRSDAEQDRERGAVLGGELEDLGQVEDGCFSAGFGEGLHAYAVLVSFGRAEREDCEFAAE